MRTKALASALILLGSTAALAQVTDTQDAPAENNMQAEEWTGSTTPNTTAPVPMGETTPPAPTEAPMGDPSEDDLTTPPTDPAPPQG